MFWHYLLLIGSSSSLKCNQSLLWCCPFDILSRIAKTTAALTRLKPVWNDKSISLSSKIRLMHSFVTSIFLYVCELWNLTAELQRKNTSHAHELLPHDTTHFIQRSCYQGGSSCQDTAGSRTTRRPPGHGKETQTAAVWSCLPFIQSGQSEIHQL